jgi:DNA-binding NarL/FixJ family response regulator
MVLLGADLPDGSSLEFLRHLQQDFPRTKAILFSTFQDMTTTI